MTEKAVDDSDKLTGAHVWSINVGLKRNQKIPDLDAPPGFACDRNSISNSNEAQNCGDVMNHANLIEKRSWDIALQPIKNLPMNVFIMYMAGNSISIIPITMVGMMFVRPIQAIMGIRSTMRMIEGSSQYWLQTFIYALGNLMGLILAITKCNRMGLLPTHPSDWLMFVEPQQAVEFVAGGMRL